METVRLAPKNVPQLVSGIRSEMFEGMKECIEQGLNYATREFAVGSNIVVVEIPAWEPVSKEHVVILHDNQHESPLLEERIARELNLSWGKAEDEVTEARITEQAFEDYLWRNLRYQ